MANVTSMKVDKGLENRSKNRPEGLSRAQDQDEEGFAANVTHKVQEVATNAVDYAKEITDTAGKKVKEMAGQVPDIIRQYPFQSLLIGFGLGFLTATLVGRIRA